MTEPNKSVPLVLYVEDDPGLGRLAERHLQRANFEVDLCSDGGSAVERVRSRRYDVLLVDYRLPGKTGLEIVGDLAATGDLPTTIMVTGGGDEAVAVDALKLGVADYLIKDVKGRYLELLPSVISRARKHAKAVEDKERAEETLRFREAMLAAVSFAATQLLSVDQAGDRDILLRELELLGTASGVDRVVLSELLTKGDGERGEELVGQWSATDTLQAGDLFALRDWNGDLALNKAVILPLDQDDKLLSHRDQIESLVAVPIFVGRQWWGILRFESLARCPWSSGEIEALRAAAAMLGAAIQRKLTDEKLRQTQEHLERTNQTLERLAAIDSVTGIPNRRTHDRRLAAEWSRCARGKIPMTVMMVDIDGFKPFNDHYGHQAGDECLRRVAGIIQDLLKRPSDHLARYGGDEFSVLLPDTDRSGAEALADELCRAVESLELHHGLARAPRTVTISIGLASRVPDIGSAAEELVAAADSALYEAKQNGRNRFEMAK